MTAAAARAADAGARMIRACEAKGWRAAAGVVAAGRCAATVWTVWTGGAGA